MLKFIFLLMIYFFVSFDMVLSLLMFLMMILFILFSLKFSLNEFFFPNLMIDKFSLGLLFLSFYMVFMLYLSMFYLKEEKDWFYLMILIYFMLMILFMSFLSLSMFVFYIFFEFSLIPIYLIIMGWGYQPERLKASMYLIFYTIFFSLPLMMTFFYFNNYLSSSLFLIHMSKLFVLNFSFLDSMIFLGVIMAFMVKLPIFFFHIWLPKAHVEAPIGGSMILASILLKLGLYGVYRMMGIMNFSNFFLLILFFCFSLMGGLYSSFMCLYQYDLKVLIAYSSVTHMGMSISSILTLMDLGVSGAYSMALSHGFCSSGLFYLAFCNYKRSMSRSFYMNKGLLNVMPNMILFWFLFCIINMSAPPFLSIFSEICMIISIISFTKMIIVIMAMMLFLSCAYSMYLFSLISHGRMNHYNFFMKDGLILEYYILFLHFLPVLLLVFVMDYSMVIF